MLPLCLLMIACGDAPAPPAQPGPPQTPGQASGQAAADVRPVLGLPIDCRIGTDCEIQNYVDRDPAGGAYDYRCGTRTYDAHTGVDFRLPDMAAQRSGVAVLAAADGVVARVRDGVQDISVDAQGAPSVEGAECGNGIVIDHGRGWTTQYCHLRRDSVSVASGDPVRAGQPIAQVGLSGNTEYAHLHMTVRHDGNVIDPFAPSPGSGDQCGIGETLWSPAVAQSLVYHAGVVLNTGFTNGPTDLDRVEEGDVPVASTDGPALVAYVRAIGLKSGDVQSLNVTGPGGETIADNLADPLPRDQAQRLLFAGKRRPPSGWTPGTYTAVYIVRREGSVVLQRRFTVTL